MIVAQVLRSFGGGGAQRAAVNLALGLAEAGHESRLVALGEPGKFAAQVADRVPCDALHLARDLRSVAGMGRLRRLLVKDRQFDVVHVHGAGTLPLVATALRRRSSPSPLLHFTWHDSSSVLGGRWWRRWLMKRCLVRCAGLSGSSHLVADHLSTQLGRPVDVLPNGVPDRGPLAEPLANPPTVVWVGRIVPEKRLEWFLHAAASVRRAGVDARFIVAGTPLPRHAEYASDVRRLAASLGDPVTFAGWVEEPDQVLRGAAIGVQTSSTEGLSLALLEMMMAGLAVIATDVGDSRAALDDGGAGVVVDPADPTTMTRELLALVTDPARRASLGATARRRAQARYSCLATAEVAARRYAESLATRSYR